MIDELSHPITIFITVLDEDVTNLFRKAHISPIKSDYKMIKGILLTWIENRSIPLLCASEKTYRIDVEKLTNEQIKELFNEWIYYD